MFCTVARFSSCFTSLDCFLPADIINAPISSFSRLQFCRFFRFLKIVYIAPRNLEVFCLASAGTLYGYFALSSYLFSVCIVFPKLVLLSIRIHVISCGFTFLNAKINEIKVQKFQLEFKNIPQVS